MSNELYHYGKLGMKWGRRSGRGISAVIKSKKKPLTKEELLKSNNPKLLYKHKKALSDGELKEKLTRLNMEKQLKDYAKGGTAKGKNFAKNALEEVGKKAVTGLIIGGTAFAVKVALDKAMGSKSEGVTKAATTAKNIVDGIKENMK